MQNTRTIIASVLIGIGLFEFACSSGTAKGTVAGIEVTVDSQRREQEFKPPGSGSGYGQMRPLQTTAANEFLVIELKSPNKIAFGDTGLKARVKDDQGQTYEMIYSQVFGFGDEKTEAKLLFEVPRNASVSMLLINDVSFDLSKVKTSAAKE
jgi:hypothetical protein